MAYGFWGGFQDSVFSVEGLELRAWSLGLMAQAHLETRYWLTWFGDGSLWLRTQNVRFQV